MSDNITLPREVVELVLDALELYWCGQLMGPKKRETITALRTALAAEQPKPEPVAVVGTQSNEIWKRVYENWVQMPLPEPAKRVHLLRDLPVGTPLYTALAAEPTKHPGYIIGSHWLETAYSRICAGEAEADVLRDIGWEPVDQALRRENERLREALKLAFASHGRMLMSDPPQDAWKFNRVDEVIAAALRREET